MTISELKDAINTATTNGQLSLSAVVLVESEPGEFDNILDVFIDGNELVISTDR